MNPNAFSDEKVKAYRLVLCQVFVTLLISALWWFFGDYHRFIAASAGGAVCVLPNLLMAYWFFRHQGAQATKRILHSFFLGEALKFLATVLLFAVALGLLKLEPLPLLVTFVAAQAVFWASPWITK